MSRVATGDELTDLGTPGQWSRIWLAVYKPNVVYTALLNGAPASNDLVGQISFDNATGTLGDVKAEMTLWVGSTAGARDLGVCRIRKAPISGTFYIGLTSEIAWVDNCHLTVVDLAMPWSKPVYVDGGVVKIDYDVSYSDQNATFTPVVRMGPHAVAWLTGATVDVGFSATAFVPGSTISAYSWTAPGASGTSGTTTATPTITYNAAGYYRVYCTVTAANGKTFTGVRHVMIFDANNMPKKIELTDDPTAGYDEGGWEFGVRMYADADTDDIVEGTLCILFGEDHFGAEETGIGAVTNRANIICVGYLDGESIVWDAEIPEVSFTVRGLHSWMDLIESNPFALEHASAAPADWFTVAGLTVDRALHHLLVWRSNIAAIADVTLTSDTRYAPLIEANDGTIWSQLNQIAWEKIFARGGVDKYGRLFVEIDPQLTPEADRTWATVMTLTEKDWQERIEAARITRKKISMVSTSGWLTQLGGATSTLYSLAMGHVRARTGGVEIVDKLLAASQSQFNTLAGLYCGWKNLEWEFDLTMPQNNRIIDLFPRQFLDVSLAAGDTPRSLPYSGNLIPRSITLRFDAEASAFAVGLSCEPETFPTLAIDGDVPASAGADEWDDSTFPLEDMPDLGDIGEIVTLPPSVENPNHPKVVVIASTKGVFYTSDFDADNPTWVAMNNGLDATAIAHIFKRLIVAPSGALWMIVDDELGNSLYRASGLGGEWVLAANGTTLGLAYGLHTGKILAVAASPDASEKICISLILQTGTGSVQSYRLAYANGSAAITVSAAWATSGVNRDHGLVHQAGKWYLFYRDGSQDLRMGEFNDSGGLSITYLITATNSAHRAAAVRSGDGFITYGSSFETGFWLVSSGGTPTYKTDLLPGNQGDPFHPIFAMSPDGTHGMAGFSTPYKTTDSGASWQSVGGVIPIGSDVWESCGDNNRWIFGGGTTLRLTVDQGASYVEKSGNLSYVAASLDILAIRYIS